jgi:electron transfer flavoprotein alpha subunit
MANIGVYIELKGDTFKKSNREALSLAKKSGKDVFAVIFTKTVDSFKGEFSGVKKVVQVAGDNLTYQPDVYAETLAQVIKENQLTDFLGVASPQGKDLIPRVAAKLDNASLINDCVELDFGANTVTKPLYAGKLLCQYKVSGDFKLYTIRPNVFPVEEDGSGEPEFVSIAPAAAEVKTNIVDVIKSEAQKIDLQEAEIIISGGRGMKEKDNFNILEELASVLNAGVGASRAAVDSEYATMDMQVGQTGKVVNPKLYIACGISGAIQHFAGMKTSKVIVAINKDPEAPIFKKADYGIVADLFKAVPLLTEELKKVL